MREQIIFNVVFLVQVLLISLYYPALQSRRMQRIFEHHPPQLYPKLYPKPVEQYERARRRFRMLCNVILFAGLALTAVLFTMERSGEWDGAVATWFFLLQFVPFAILDFSAVKEFKLMRVLDSRTMRSAALQRRQLTDYAPIGAWMLALAIWAAFCVFIIYLRQFEYPWFGGYANIAGVTGLNVFFGLMVARSVYGRKLDPHQSDEDRARQVSAVVRIALFTSIAVTVYITVSIALSVFEMKALQPITRSLYFQLLAMASMQVYRAGNRDYEVYREGRVEQH